MTLPTQIHRRSLPLQAQAQESDPQASLRKTPVTDTVLHDSIRGMKNCSTGEPTSQLIQTSAGNSQKFRNGLAVTPTLHTSVLGVIGMSIQTSGARLVTPCTDPMISFVPTMISPRKRSPHLKSTTGPAAVTSIVVNTIVSFSGTHPRLTVS
ncbi:hypothetical protein B2J93_6545 [Marssonina coronariae]|uniref:Uncharacterized protein n=1 Tax=Diplocarpon coronariae TaxID=2795749 RepID=A0A218Z1E7_9HELO|nr:hypothetical protein B2J93_6545 [Marssonina coronariae]